MKKKEYYKHNLPHFQQPGQAYFVTWSLKDTVPKKALKQYSQRLEILKSQIGMGAVRSADFSNGSQCDDPPLRINRGSESASPELEKL
ncbi:MAG: hypothetical protein L3J11_04445 [Draconibacterium sp.]|nr:hypothetical protein [Draconibacterium sp.]